MADIIEMDHAAMLRQIAELDKTLADLEKSVSGDIKLCYSVFLNFPD